MKAIKDCKWWVDITGGSHDYFWDAYAGDIVIDGVKEFKTIKGCKKNFERFARLNGITKYAFFEEKS